MSDMYSRHATSVKRIREGPNSASHRHNTDTLPITYDCMHVGFLCYVPRRLFLHRMNAAMVYAVLPDFLASCGGTSSAEATLRM